MNHIDLNSIQNVQDIEDSQAEKCVGGNFIVDLGDYGATGTTAPFLVEGNTRDVYVGGSLEQLTVANTSSSSNNQFSVSWLDRNGNTTSTGTINPSETIDIPNSNGSQPVFARISEA